MKIACIDTETTGLNKNTDRVIQLSCKVFDSETGQRIASLNKYILPSGTWKINPDAQAVHNLSEEFIRENGVSLREVFPELMELIGDLPILTYNGSSFDICFLQREFEREGLDAQFEKHSFIDSFDIERRVNSNKLGDAYRRYYGRDFENAHDSSADVDATIDVYMAQLKAHGTAIDAETGVEIIKESNDYVTDMMRTSPEGFVYTDKDGVLRFRIGKFKEYPVVDVCKNNPSYIKWLFTPNNGDNVCTNITKRSIRNAYYSNTDQDK
jgi:DNA polymerase III epsilon subunit-like protein